jgi:HD-GYP domain-containing protein (c-di-GMP phosphodiesterase class II)
VGFARANLRISTRPHPTWSREVCVKRIIRLKGMNGATKGRAWESSELLRIGRLDPLEIVLDDNSVSRYHAEVRATDRGWRVRDLGSTNGTRLNGVRLGNGQWPLRVRDLLQFGEVAFIVEALHEEVGEEQSPQALPTVNVPTPMPTGLGTARPAQPAPGGTRPHPALVPFALAPGIPEDLQVEGTARSSWEEALTNIAFDSNHRPRAGDQLLALIRASHTLVHLEREEDLLHSTLKDAVDVLDAQRGAFVLADGPSGELQLRAIATGRNQPRAALAGRGELSSRFRFSHSLANRSYSRGESILCHKAEEDPELAMAKSIAEGAMASIMCVLLRTPRKKLGVMHLDRGPWQKPFTMEDLHLADALAASVSAGIECAALLRKQRDLFLDTITMLADVVEMRDAYTGGHTQRVSNYSLLLVERLDLPVGDVDLIRTGTPLHDIGKVGIPDAILQKPDKLTPEEFETMKTHTVIGAEFISKVPDLRPVLPIVRSHHERWDGRGYPDALAGDNIPHLARVVALADAFDAMTSDRPYRKGMPVEVAFAEIEKGKGLQFDPNFAAAFLDIKEAIIRALSHKGLLPPSSNPELVVV